MSNTLRIFFEFVDKSAREQFATAAGIRGVTQAIEEQQKAVRAAERETRRVSIANLQEEIEERRSKLASGGESDAAKLRREMLAAEAKLGQESATQKLAIMEEENRARQTSLDSTLGMVGAVHTIATEMVQVASAAWDVANAVGSAYARLVQFSVKQTEMARYAKANLGAARGQENGNDLYREFDRVSNYVGVDRKSVISAGTRLATTGKYNDRDTLKALGATADLTALTGESRSQNMLALTELLANAAEDPSAGIHEKDLTAVQKSTGNLVTRDRFLAAYRSRWESAHDATMRPGQEEEDLKSAGGLDSRFLQPILEQLSLEQSAQATGDNQGKLGGFAAQFAAGSPTIQLGKIYDDIDRLATVDEKKLEPLAKFLGRLDKLLDPDGPTGKKVTEFVDRMLTALTKLSDELSTPEGMKRAEDNLQRLLVVLEKIADVMLRLTASGGGLLEKILGVGGEKDPMKIARAHLGPAVPDGVIEAGILRDRQRAAKWEKLPFLDKLKAKLTGEFDDSVDDIPQHAAGGLVTRPHLGIVGEAGPELIIPLDRVRDTLGGMNGSSTVHAPVTVNLQIGSATAETADAIADKLETVLPSMLATTFERMGLQAGAV